MCGKLAQNALLSVSLGWGVESPPMSEIRIGTSAFTAEGWVGSFYPKGLKPADYLSF
jgi:hypothetical protein